jgi:tetratricopeptide (TPR) repeat protein
MRLGMLILAALTALGAGQSGPTPAALRAQGNEAIYNLDHDRAAELFRQAIAADPNDPASYRAAAKNAWLRILYIRGAVNADQYLGKMASSDIKVPPPPEPYASEFRRNIEKAISLAEAAVSRNPRSADAHYELGAALGYQATYTGTIEGRMFGAMRAARRAFSEHERVLDLDGRRRDAGLVIGTYRYIVAGLPMPVRWVAYVIGFGGGKETGITRLQEAAAYPGDAQTDARFALVLVYNREGRYDEALTEIRRLERSFPGNRLLWLEEGGTLVRAKRPAEAERALDLGIDKMEREGHPRMGGEAQMLFYKRGLARFMQKQVPAAQADFEASLADRTGAAWITGRVHAELGKIADLAGDRARARREYQAAVTLGEQSSDPAGAEVARKLLDAPYRQ